MQELYLIGWLPGWLVALIGGAAAALLVSSFPEKTLAAGQCCFSPATRAGLHVLLFFLFGPA
jgi:hypothetical protein